MIVSTTIAVKTVDSALSRRRRAKIGIQPSDALRNGCDVLRVERREHEDAPEPDRRRSARRRACRSASRSAPRIARRCELAQEEPDRDRERRGEEHRAERRDERADDEVARAELARSTAFQSLCQTKRARSALIAGHAPSATRQTIAKMTSSAEDRGERGQAVEQRRRRSGRRGGGSGAGRPRRDRCGFHARAAFQRAPAPRRAASPLRHTTFTSLCTPRPAAARETPRGDHRGSATIDSRARRRSASPRPAGCRRQRETSSSTSTICRSPTARRWRSRTSRSTSTATRSPR